MAYRAKSLSIRGLKPLKEQLNAVSGALDGAEVYEGLSRAVKPLQMQARANAMRISTEIAVSIYVADKQPPSRPKKKTVMVVAHKADTMRRWTARAGNKSPKAKVAAGREVAESLASMFELGTSKMPARPYFRPAVDSTKGEVVQNVKDEIVKLIETATARKATSE